MSKSPAKSAAPPKKAVKKPAAAAHKAPAKKVAPAKASKPVSKAAAKAPAKPAPKAVVAKPSPKGAAKPAPKPAAKAAPKKIEPVPVTKTASKPVASPVPDKSPAPVAKPAAVQSKPVAKTSGRAAAKAMASAAPMADPAPASRFADRFAPMRTSRPIAMDEPIRPTVKFDPKLVNAWKSKSGRDLTEPELLAMPDTEYMNDKQLEFFRLRLTALKDDLLSNAGETTEHLREDTSIVPDPADRATIEEEHALELRTRDRERKLLKKISQSLARIEAGDYGYCDETGEPIGLARLLARPTATLSLEAQQRREMKQKMFGD